MHCEFSQGFSWIDENLPPNLSRRWSRVDEPTPIIPYFTIWLRGTSEEVKTLAIFCLSGTPLWLDAFGSVRAPWLVTLTRGWWDLLELSVFMYGGNLFIYFFYFCPGERRKKKESSTPKWGNRVVVGVWRILFGLTAFETFDLGHTIGRNLLEEWGMRVLWALNS